MAELSFLQASRKCAERRTQDIMGRIQNRSEVYSSQDITGTVRAQG